MRRWLLITGRLAEPALRAQLPAITELLAQPCDIAVLGITVAALMHVDWVARKLPTLPPGITDVLLPGYLQGDLQILRNLWNVRVQLGPKDLADIPEFFGRQGKPPPDLSRYDIEILAEINHAPRLSRTDLLALAGHYRASGADLVDLGCIPGEPWPAAALTDTVHALRDQGFRVSIDSFDRSEVEAAVAAGVELVLSCNATNRDWAAHLPAELVAIPDDPRDLDSLALTLDVLSAAGAHFRIDPILEPIGFGFAASLARYAEARRRWPQHPMLMGVGNLTELSEVDSAGINLLLAGFCQELGITSVLTTEVINYCRSAVREFDLARRIVAHSVSSGRLPKHVDPRLALLRDTRLKPLGCAALHQLQSQLKDPNFRIFAERGEIHILNRDGYWHGPDPYDLFDQLGPLEASHAFYLGYELAKAKTALTLGKQYRQDEALNWGFLTEPEISALHRRSQSAAFPPPAPQ